ncbi:transposase [Verrucomicrobiota bacterium]
MRKAREKVAGVDSYYHVYNRTVGMPSDMPFGPREKARFLRTVKGLAEFYVIEVTSFVTLGNHYHLTLFVPAEVPSKQVTCERYEKHYRGRRKLDPDSVECERISLMLRDLSAFMHDLQQQFTVWYNRTRVPGQRRRGSLWADRFKNKLLRTASAIWHCLLYQAMNPVRAELVTDPARYPHSCWGLWELRRRHPFGDSVSTRIIPRLRCMLQIGSLEQLRARLREELTRQCESSDRSLSLCPVVTRR